MPLFIHNKTDKSLYIVRQRVTLLTPLPKFAAASKSLHETLFADGVKIEIPDYQREFSWEQDRLELFYDDLIAPKPEVKSGKFCGTTLRLDLDEGLPMELIDGQQRTTVAHLVMATLRDIAMDHEDCFGIAMTVQNDLEVGDQLAWTEGVDAHGVWTSHSRCCQYRDSTGTCPTGGGFGSIGSVFEVHRRLCHF